MARDNVSGYCPVCMTGFNSNWEIERHMLLHKVEEKEPSALCKPWRAGGCICGECYCSDSFACKTRDCGCCQEGRE